MRRILVIQLYRAGDILQSFPVLRGLRSAHPGALIDLLTDELLTEVGALCPDADRVLGFPRPVLRRLLQEPGGNLAALYLAASTVERLRAERYDLVVNLHMDALGRRIAGALGVGRTLGPVQPPLGPQRLMGQGTRDFFDAIARRRESRRNLVDHFLGLADLPPGIRGAISLPRSASMRADGLLAARIPGRGPLVVVQSGASRAFKGLPTAWIRAVQERLPGARFGWIGSSGERAAIEEALAAGLKGACLAGETSFPEAAAVVARAALVVSGDTAALHLAALLGRPSVSAYFGAQRPQDTGPYGDGHFCLFEPPECAPCDLAEGCDRPVCKDGLSAALLAEAGASALEGGPPPPGVWVSSLGPRGLEWSRSAAPARAGSLAAA